MITDHSLISRAGCLAYNPKLKKRSRQMRNNMTNAEKYIWDKLLRKHKYLFHRQKIINHYIVDFYCSKLKLVIEIDGEIHTSKNAVEYDQNRTDILGGLGLAVIRFTNNEVLNEIETCEMKIEEYINHFNG